MQSQSPNQPLDLWWGTRGNPNAEIVVVGEAWGAEEHNQKKPFVGASGRELSRILAEGKIDESKVFFTNVCAARPPGNDFWQFFNPAKEHRGKGSALRGLHPGGLVLGEMARLHDQLRAYPRRAILCTGNYSLWACTDSTGYSTGAETEGRRVPTGIMNWRGSMHYANQVDKLQHAQLIPLIHPAAILRQWELRAITVHDLRARVPLALQRDWRPDPAPVFWAPPTFANCVLKLRNWITRADAGEHFQLACDIETAKKSIITVIGLSDSIHFGMAIPFVANGQFEDYWTHEQEVQILKLLRRILTHPNILLVGQNFIYDTQFLEAFLAVVPRVFFDTMLAQHLLWPGTPKGLDYISSLYCHYHWYWKEDGKEWDGKGTLADLLLYNCVDLVRTFEAFLALDKLIDVMQMRAQWRETLERHELALRMMRRGVKIDRARRGRIGLELAEKLNELYASLNRIIPDTIVPKGKTSKSSWWNSPMQQQWVFGQYLGMKLPRHRKTGRVTLGKEALAELPKKYPEFSGLFKRLKAVRSIEVFQSHFVQAPLDHDGRMRCEFKPAGTETHRWSSSANAMGKGTNLQNIPAGDED